jgi:hypothetical protein
MRTLYAPRTHIVSCIEFPGFQETQTQFRSAFRWTTRDARTISISPHCPNACDGVTVSIPPTPQVFGGPGRTIGAGRNSRTLSRRRRGGGAIEAGTCASSRARWNQCLRSRIRCAKLPSIRSRDIQNGDADTRLDRGEEWPPARPVKSIRRLKFESPLWAGRTNSDSLCIVAESSRRPPDGVDGCNVAAAPGRKDQDGTSDAHV